MEREDFENMVSAMLADAVKPVLRDVSELRTRIIGIDGNGTGRKGALQRQDEKLLQLDEGQKYIIEQLHALTTSSETWNKKRVWRAIKWMFATILTVLALMMSWMGYRAAQKPPKPIVSIHSTNNTEAPANDAGVDGR